MKLKSKKEITKAIEDVIDQVKQVDHANPLHALLAILCANFSSMTMILIDIRDILNDFIEEDEND